MRAFCWFKSIDRVPIGGGNIRFDELGHFGLLGIRSSDI
jgi:hypothetical protein